MMAQSRASEKAIASLAAAFGHPLRVRILDALAAGPSSASRMEAEFGDAGTGVHYHLRALEKLNVVELHETRPVRGFAQYVFRLRPRASWGKLWEAIPLPILPGWRSAAFRQFVEVAVAALNAGALNDRVDTTFTAGAITLDRKGLGEVNEAFQGVLKTVDQIERSSRRRLVRNPDGEIPTVIAAAVFEAPPNPDVQLSKESHAG